MSSFVSGFFVQYYIPETPPCVELEFTHLHCCTLSHFQNIMKMFNVFKTL